MKRLMILLAALLTLSGCAPTAREPDRLDLVRVLGADGSGPVTLTGVCGAEQGEVRRGTAEGADFFAALEQLAWSGRRELAVTSVTWLVVGPDTELEALALAVLRENELGAAVTLWLAPGGAAETLNACDDPAADLELLLDEGVEPPTAARAAAALCGGETVELPCLTAQDGRLTWQGMAICRSER